MGYALAHYEKALRNEIVVLTVTDIVRSLALREDAGPVNTGNLGTLPAQQGGPSRKRAAFRALPPAGRKATRIRVRTESDTATGAARKIRVPVLTS